MLDLLYLFQAEGGATKKKKNNKKKAKAENNDSTPAATPKAPKNLVQTDPPSVSIVDLYPDGLYLLFLQYLKITYQDLLSSKILFLLLKY